MECDFLCSNIIKNISPDIRRLFDMKNVIFDEKWLDEQKENKSLYYMYRGIELSEKDKKIISSFNLRYDITIIFSTKLGIEFNKTAGHYHSLSSNNISYPEVYEVLEGEALYLMQSEIKNDCVEETSFIFASKGDKIVIPPNYGHFTINIGSGNLIMANWICADCVSNYDKIKEKKGACYYVVLKDSDAASKNKIDKIDIINKHSKYKNNNTSFVFNANYKDTSKLVELKALELPEFGLIRNKEMYYLVNDIEKLDFLVNPEKYEELWKSFYLLV